MWIAGFRRHAKVGTWSNAKRPSSSKPFDADVAVLGSKLVTTSLISKKLSRPSWKGKKWGSGGDDCGNASCLLTFDLGLHLIQSGGGQSMLRIFNTHSVETVSLVRVSFASNIRSQARPHSIFVRRTMSDHYDALIMGSGQSGSPLTSAFAAAHKRVALIESAHVGGTCINEGCTPTKTMIASGRVAYLARRAADYGVNTSEPAIDMVKIRQRKRDIVNSFRGGSERRLESAGVEVIRGTGSFVDKKTVKVVMNEGNERHLTADTIFINTGARPSRPDIPTLNEINPNLILDSTSILELDEVPKHLLILGGGPIALEFAQLFHRLGAVVTIIQRSSQLLPREDPDIAAEMHKILTEDGIRILLNTSAKNIYAPNPDMIALNTTSTSADDPPERTLQASHLLLATGRTANTDTLNLSAAGVQMDKHGYITVSPTLETSTPGIYALGDVKGGPAFTHVSYDDFRIIRHNFLSSPPSDKKMTTEGRAEVYVTYTDPQLAHVGLHEHEARLRFPEKGRVKVAKMPMSYVARALETDESRGVMKAVVDGETGRVLGFTMIGLEAGELMSCVQVAMMGGVGWRELQGAVFAHPSLAEGLNNLWGFLE